MSTMRQILATGLMMFTLALASGQRAQAADKTYQVTGPVLEITDTTVTVSKGKEKWLLARDAATKITGELKVGAKVTIEYKMTATTIEVKGASAAEAKAAAKAEAAKPADAKAAAAPAAPAAAAPAAAAAKPAAPAAAAPAAPAPKK